MSRLKRLVLYLLALCVALFAVLEGVVLAGCRDDVQQDAPVMIVLGAKVWQDGPSPALKRRLDKALDYLNEHPDVVVIVSGGQGGNESVSEAQAMEDYLLSAGLDGGRIYKEEKSTSTMENLLYSKKIMEQIGFDPTTTPVIVVSNAFHLARVRMLCGRVGLQADTLGTPMPDAASAIYSYSREAFALVKSFLLDRGAT
jgi:uncharacterized SAM-binding protein YcdF (DUF218 family)